MKGVKCLNISDNNKIFVISQSFTDTIRIMNSKIEQHKKHKLEITLLYFCIHNKDDNV